MIQLRQSRVIQLAVRKVSVQCCICALLAANSAFAENLPTAPDSANLGTVDIHEYSMQVSATAVPATIGDHSEFNRPNSSSQSGDRQNAGDQVEDVFGDIVEIVGPSAMASKTRIPATPKSTTRSPQSEGEPETTQAAGPKQPIALAPSPKDRENEQTEEELPAHVASLRQPLERCLAMHRQQLLNNGEHSTWSMMHAFLGWGPSAEIRVGGPRSPNRARILTWLSMNRPAAGRQLLYVSNGRIKGREGPGYQGHPAQFLAMLAQTNTPLDNQLQVQGHKFTVSDLVKEEQLTCREPMELTFKLIGLSHYLDTDTRWRNERGESWNLSRIIRAELKQPINGAACGGTHRIMGFSYSVMKRKAEGKPIEGQWWRAEKYTQDYREYTMALQNPDGSFSSDWFKGRATWGGIDRKIQTTGHILEWLVYSSTEEELNDPRMARSVSLLVKLLIQHRYHEWEYGPKGHAIRALRLYHERVFGGEVKQRTHPLVDHPQQPHQQRSPRSALKRLMEQR